VILVPRSAAIGRPWPGGAGEAEDGYRHEVLAHCNLSGLQLAAYICDAADGAQLIRL
jgi:hypothetical protein